MYKKLVIGAAALLGSVTTNAHTTSLGYAPGASVGSIIIWTGTYHAGPIAPEGTGTLSGVSLVYSQTKAFSIGSVSTKPVGLIDGTNNFYWSQSPYTYPQNTDPGLAGGVVTWQGASFTGLAPGDYTYSCGNTCGTSFHWDTLPGASGSVPIHLTQANITPPPAPGVPEPASWAMLVAGFGLVGASARRRRAAVVTA